MVGHMIDLGVMLIDFSPVVRAGLQAILATDNNIRVTGDVPNGVEALLHIKKLYAIGKPVHVVLTETRNEKMDGVQATRLIKEAYPEIHVLVLTENLNDTLVIDAIHAGAGGYIFLKDTMPELLIENIYRVARGGTQIKTDLLFAAVENLINNGRKTLAERTTEAAHLTAREVDVLRLMGNGDSNKAIANSLGITLDTTKKHVSNVTDKLEAKTRIRAAIIAAQAGIVGNPVTTLVPKANL